MNGGTCIDGIDNSTCSCPPQLTGVLCECLILEDNSLDCTYVSPIPSTLSYELTTIMSVPTSVISHTTFSSTSIETTKVPTTEIVPRTENPEFYNRSQETTIGVIETTVSSSPTTFSTPQQTIVVTDIENISESITTTTFPSPVFSTSLIPFPPITTESTLITTLGSTTELVTQFTELPESTNVTNITFSSEVTSPESTTELTTVYSTKFTTPEEMKTFQSYYPTVTVPSTITSVRPTTFSVETTTLLQNITSFTIQEETEEISTTVESTIKLTDMPVTTKPTTVSITSTTKEYGTNRTFPEEMSTTFPSVSTFFTTQPVSKTELTSLPNITTEEITTTSPPEETTFTSTLPSIDCTRSDTPCANGGTCVFTGSGHKV